MKEGDETRVNNKESNLYNQQLESYLSASLKQGYTPDQLQDYLKNKGYDPSSVRESLKEVNKKYYGNSLEIHGSSKSHLFLIYILFALAIIFTGSFFYFQNSVPFESEIILLNSDILVGESLSFDIFTTRQIFLEIVITTSEGNMVLQKTDVIDYSKTYTLILPDDVPVGHYTADISIEYKDEKKEKSFLFAIISPKIITQIPSSEISENYFTKFKTAVNLKKTDLCQEINDNVFRDECYFSIAKETKNETICEYISEFNKKEICYLTQVLNGNLIKCTILEDPQNMAICENLS